MGTMSLEATVRELADAEAIRNLARRYAHHVWQKNVPAAVGLFTEDGEMDTGDRPAIKGRQALLAAYEEMFAEARFQPFVHNHVITLNGERATGTCYLDLRAAVGGKSMIGSGYYDDHYVQVDGEWRFRSRKLTMCFFVPLSEGWAEGDV
jgi:ketosteroid isomerase-like protein